MGVRVPSRAQERRRVHFSELPDDRYPEASAAFGRLLHIMDTLRERCPWDREQTLQSLRHLTIEEVYELGEAILQEDDEELLKELGDLLLHIVFYARIGKERGRFDMREVIDRLCQKLIDRHPHIYGAVEARDAEAVKQNWEKIKLRQKGGRGVLEGVPAALPALVKAQRIQDKAAGVGFDWETREQVWAKVEEEIQELKAAEKGEPEKVEEEFGDLLFALVNYGRFLKLNAEDALEKANRKFIHRFGAMEALAQAQNGGLDGLSLKEMDQLWEAVKAAEKKRVV
ncbi:MAG: nucleoside triphosphate pyrophosphohydrolase [Flavobacteriales bacterium]|nr:nucleoside triphosphate pyrophosphohydrolase [Flavobacteriales bacterium]